MNKALYVGSFDPITMGHLWVIQEASKLFDEVLVAIASNPEKSCKYSSNKREYFVQESVKDFNNVSVKIMPNVFHIDFAKDNEAQYLIRGIRNPIDLEQETQILRFNERRNPNIRPVFLMPPKNLSDISSSLVKGITNIDKWETEMPKMVPFRVLEEMCEDKLLPVFSNSRRSSILEKFVETFNNLNILNDRKCKILSLKELDNILYSQYRSDNSLRYYHNTNHLSKCFKWLDLYESILISEEREFPAFFKMCFWETKLVLQAAIFFHDYYYDCRSDENESNSAEYAFNFFSPYHEVFAREVYHIISATDYRRKNDDLFLSKVGSIMRDIDLAELGADYKTFETNSINVMKEYIYLGNYSPSEVIDGRRKFLEDFSQREIFSTDFFKRNLEKTAHENITNELNNMEKFEKLLFKST